MGTNRVASDVVYCLLGYDDCCWVYLCKAGQVGDLERDKYVGTILTDNLNIMRVCVLCVRTIADIHHRTESTHLYVSNLQRSEASVVGDTGANVPPQLSKINPPLLAGKDQYHCIKVIRIRAGGDVKRIIGRLIRGKIKALSVDTLPVNFMRHGTGSVLMERSVA